MTALTFEELCRCLDPIACDGHSLDPCDRYPSRLTFTPDGSFSKNRMIWNIHIQLLKRRKRLCGESYKRKSHDPAYQFYIDICRCGGTPTYSTTIDHFEPGFNSSHSSSTTYFWLSHCAHLRRCNHNKMI